MQNSSKFILGQIGMPRHYAVAKILFANNLLDKLIVDTYFSEKNWLSKLPFAGKMLLHKLKSYNAGIDDDLVMNENKAALYMRFLLKYSTKTKAFDFAGKRLNQRVINYAQKTNHENFYGFDTSSLEFLQWSKGKGWKTFVEQCVAPRNSQIQMWQLFNQKYKLDSRHSIQHASHQQQRETGRMETCRSFNCAFSIRKIRTY